MLRACLAAAIAHGQVSVFLEPIALYHERDLHEAGDRGWLGDYTADGHAPIGSARVHGDGSDLTIVTFGNGVRMSLRVAAPARGGRHRRAVLDLRWLAPLPIDDLLLRGRDDRAGARRGRDPALAAGSARACSPRSSRRASAGRMARVASEDSFVPLGDAAEPRAAQRGRDRGRGTQPSRGR